MCLPLAKYRVPEDRIAKQKNNTIKWNSRWYLTRSNYLIWFPMFPSLLQLQWLTNLAPPFFLWGSLHFPLILPPHNLHRTSPCLSCCDIFKTVTIFCKSYIRRSIFCLYTLEMFQAISTLLVPIREATCDSWTAQMEICHSALFKSPLLISTRLRHMPSH